MGKNVLTLDEIYEPISLELDQVELELDDRLKVVSKYKDIMDKILKYFFEVKGKKLRPALTILASRSLEPTEKLDIDMVNKLGISVELIHNASLIHDDIIDDSEYRRDQLTLNKKFSNRIGVLTGDILYTYALSLFANRVGVEILEILFKCVEKMCKAEIRKLTKSINTLDEYLEHIENKTAFFMAICCQGGAMIANGSESQIKALADFGLNFGIAYQLIDDYMDDDHPVKIECDIPKKAEDYIIKAKTSIGPIEDSVYKQSLIQLADYILSRNHLGTHIDEFTTSIS
ncbi:polyprenyl synthetase family protein [bacterium]|nr:polyprenyl synthetase family protein [bacterium]